MTVPLFLQLSSPNYFMLFLLYGFFLINEYSIRSRRIQYWLWQYLLMELFYIDGECKNSGYCCSNLHLDVDGVKIDNDAKLKTLQRQFPEYSCFYFLDRKESSALMCSCLKGNRCLDYQNRPKVCSDYPVNRFVKEGYIRSGCGYQVQKRNNLPRFKNKKLLSMMYRVEFLNNIL